jgi:hypothetical protein
VKVDSSIEKINFILGLHTLPTEAGRVSQISFQQVCQPVFLEYAINKDRTHAIAVGLGFTYNNYIQNLANWNWKCLYILLLTENSI